MNTTTRQYDNRIVVTRVLDPDDEEYNESSKLFDHEFSSDRDDEIMRHHVENEENGH